MVAFHSSFVPHGASTMGFGLGGGWVAGLFWGVSGPYLTMRPVSLPAVATSFFRGMLWRRRSGGFVRMGFEDCRSRGFFGGRLHGGLTWG